MLVAGTWYPLVKMHWVEGQTLNEFVRNTLKKPDTLAAPRAANASTKWPRDTGSRVTIL